MNDYPSPLRSEETTLRYVEVSHTDAELQQGVPPSGFTVEHNPKEHVVAVETVTDHLGIRHARVWIAARLP